MLPYKVCGYWTFLVKEEDGYTVLVPDLRGCVTVGDTVAEAVRNAREAISLWVETAQECGDPVPPPSPLVKARDKARKLL